MLYEAIPVWERAYAVSETKRSVEGAAGTRGADKVTSPSPPCVNLPGYTSKFTIFSQNISTHILTVLTTRDITYS